MALSPLKLNQLRHAMRVSRRKLSVFRDTRMRSLEQFVGFHYSHNGARDRVPINLIELAVNIYVRLLASNVPRVSITSKQRELRPFAATFSHRMNDVLAEIQFGRSLRRFVKEAMFSIGIMKVGVTYGIEHEIDGYLHDAGQSFADPVSLDDWVHDMTAKRWDQCAYMGDRYTVPFELAMDTVFKGQDLQPSEIKEFDEHGGTERARFLSSGFDLENASEFSPVLELWDIYIPRENIVVTITEKDDMSKPVRTVEWDGDERGPYHTLLFNEVPDNIMPLAPVGLWMDLHELANRLFRKLGRQAERQKTVTVVQAGAEADGSRVQKSSDGDIIKSDRPEATKEMKFGGPANENLAFLLQVRDLFAYIGGNLDALGGLSPQASTLGQEELLASNASQRIQDMAEQTYVATKGIVQSLAFNEWTDPMREAIVVKQVAGTQRSIEVPWGPEIREGDFVQHDIDIDPHSLQPSSSQQKLAAMTNVYQNYVIPLLPMMEQQGIVPDIQKTFDFIATHGNLPELRDMLDITSPVESSGEPRQSPVTTRREERRSVPAPSRHGRDHVMSQLLMGQGSQQSEQI